MRLLRVECRAANVECRATNDKRNALRLGVRSGRKPVLLKPANGAPVLKKGASQQAGRGDKEAELSGASSASESDAEYAVGGAGGSEAIFPQPVREPKLPPAPLTSGPAPPNFAFDSGEYRST